MIAIPNKPQMTPDEYLEWEAQQECRHEYLDGEAYAMTAGTLPHNDIALNFYSSLRDHVRTRGCRINAIDAKTQLAEQGPFFYPDLLVSCDPRDKAALKFVQFPCLIVEVLSPSTESYDRGEKFAQYRRLESLQEYVLISSTKISVEIFRLNERQKWELTPYEAGETLQLTSVDFACPIEQLYEAVELLPQALDSAELKPDG